MFGKLFDIAKTSLAGVDEKAEGLPAPQVTVLYTDNDYFYIAVNDIDGAICDELKEKNDTKIVRMLTMWKDGGVDQSSLSFRRALVALDEYNYDTEIILQGEDGYSVIKLAVTLPATAREAEND